MLTLPERDYRDLVRQIATQVGALTPAAAVQTPAAAARPADGQAPCAWCGGACAGACVKEFLSLGACRLSACPPAPALADGIAAFIDHTLLKPEATQSDVERLCDEADRFGFASVCLNPTWVPLAAARLRATPVLVCTVIGFPLGATTTSSKRFEAAECLKLGADELDMVLNVGALKTGLDDAVRADIRAVVEVAHAAGARVKVILETALLDDGQKVRACQLAQAAGADFVKTSTGFVSVPGGGGGATTHDVALMRATVGDCMGVKASGGVRSYQDALAMVEAGATRIGASASVAIVEQAGGAAATPGATSGY